MAKDGEFLAFNLYSQDQLIKFANLPNIHNQKYTIGRTYLGRESQGEFICCMLQGVENSHCEILCENGTFWVTSLNDAPTFINDQQIKGKFELKFSNYLTLGGESVENNKVMKNGRPYRYKSLDLFFCERTFNIPIGPLNFNFNSSIDFIPGHNDLILSKILSFLPHSDLKALKKISSSWNNEAVRILKKNSVVKFTSENMLNCFLQYQKDMNKLKISHCEFNLSDFPFFPESKLIEDLKVFLKSHDCVHELKLLIDLPAQSAAGNLILSKSFNSLRKLELRGPLASDYFHIFYQEHDWKFPNLKILIFSKYFGMSEENSEAEAVTLSLLSYFLKIAPFLSAISMPKLSQPNSEPLLNELLQFREIKISSISLGYCTPIILAPIFGFQKPLKKLWLEGLDGFLNRDFRILEKLLEKNSEWLESFKLGLKSFLRSDGLKSFRLPKLPKLHYLNIKVEFSPGMREFEFNFPGGSIVNYRDHFPKLQHLVLRAIPQYKIKHYLKNDNVLFPFLHDGADEILCDPSFMRDAKKLSFRIVKAFEVELEVE